MQALYPLAKVGVHNMAYQQVTENLIQSPVKSNQWKESP